MESTAGITRLSSYVALHSIAGSRVALAKLFSVQPQLRSSVCCLADLALLQSHLAPVQSDVAGRWRWCRRRRIQPHVALVFSYLSELQPNIAELQSHLAFLQPDFAELQPNESLIQSNLSIIQPNITKLQPNKSILQSNIPIIQPNKSLLLAKQSKVQSDVSILLSNIAILLSDKP